MLGLPGCRGIFYLLGKEDTSIALTLWDDEDSLAASRPVVDRIRAETTAEQHMEILGVDEFEVLTHQLRE